MLLQWLITAAVIFAVCVVALLLLRRFLSNRTMAAAQSTGRTRQPRLGVVDVFDLDRQRQLVLLRRDNVEHLVMIGGPNDVVVEQSIHRSQASRTTPSVDALIERALQADDIPERESTAADGRSIAPEPRVDPRTQPKPQRSPANASRLGESTPVRGEISGSSRSAPKPGDETVLNDMTRQLEEALKKPFSAGMNSGARQESPLPTRREPAPLAGKGASSLEPGDALRASPSSRLSANPNAGGGAPRQAPPVRAAQKVDSAPLEGRPEPKLSPPLAAAGKSEAPKVDPSKLDLSKLDAPQRDANQLEPPRADHASTETRATQAGPQPRAMQSAQARQVTATQVSATQVSAGPLMASPSGAVSGAGGTQGAAGPAPVAGAAEQQGAASQSAEARSAAPAAAQSAASGDVKAEPSRVALSVSKELDPFSPEAIEAEFARLLGRLPSKSEG